MPFLALQFCILSNAKLRSSNLSAQRSSGFVEESEIKVSEVLSRLRDINFYEDEALRGISCF